MGLTAICIQCGSFKSSFSERCAHCEFEPESPLDIAKSRILGKPYAFAIGTEGDVVETGRSKAELKAISEQVKAGVPYSFPSEELAGVLQVYNETQQITGRQLLVAVAKWIAPPLALGAVFVALLLLRR